MSLVRVLHLIRDKYNKEHATCHKKMAVSLVNCGRRQKESIFETQRVLTSAYATKVEKTVPPKTDTLCVLSEW